MKQFLKFMDIDSRKEVIINLSVIWKFEQASEIDQYTVAYFIPGITISPVRLPIKYSKLVEELELLTD